MIEDAVVTGNYHASELTGRVYKDCCQHCFQSGTCTLVFAELEDALRLGYKLCIRCQADCTLCENCTLVKLAIEDLERNYTQKFSLQKLADSLFINKDYLGRIFKNHIGETPLKYHNYVRCEHARQLLETNNISVSDISWKVGYQTESHFIKVFKSFYNTTPLQYRNAVEHVGFRTQLQ